MISMFSQRSFPKKISPGELDTYLANGWYRSGQMVFTTQMLFANQHVYPTVWTRLPLHNYKMGKRLRKVYRNNQARFNTYIRPFVNTHEKELLYEQHKDRFEGYVVDTLSESLYGPNTDNIFKTFEVAVYDQNKLIALSIFDIGQYSIASIKGLYLKEYQKYSLGHYTLMCEILFGIEKNMQYHYSGYIAPGFRKFDYKKRVGNLQYLNVASGKWQCLSTLQAQKLPIEETKLKINELQTQLNELLPTKQLIYPFYDVANWYQWDLELLTAPLFLSCFYNTQLFNYLTIEYSWELNAYLFRRCQTFFNPFLNNYNERYNPQNHCLDLLAVDDTIAVCSTIAEVKNFMKKWLWQYAV